MVVTDSMTGLSQSVLRQQAEDTRVGELTNWRNLSHKKEDYKNKVLSGEIKIMNFIAKAVIAQTKLIQINKTVGRV